MFKFKIKTADLNQPLTKAIHRLRSLRRRQPLLRKRPSDTTSPRSTTTAKITTRTTAVEMNKLDNLIFAHWRHWVLRNNLTCFPRNDMFSWNHETHHLTALFALLYESVAFKSLIQHGRVGSFVFSLFLDKHDLVNKISCKKLFYASFERALANCLLNIFQQSRSLKNNEHNFVREIFFLA